MRMAVGAEDLSFEDIGKAVREANEQRDNGDEFTSLRLSIDQDTDQDAT